MRLISIIATALVLAGCGPSEQTSRETNAIEAAKKMAQRHAEERQQAEARLREQETQTSRWQFATVLAVSVSAFALILGAILGSRARHDAEP